MLRDLFSTFDGENVVVKLYNPNCGFTLLNTEGSWSHIVVQLFVEKFYFMQEKKHENYEAQLANLFIR